MNLTYEMLSGVTVYVRDNLLWSETVDAGLDVMDKATFASNGYIIDQEFTAPFGTSTWSSQDIPEEGGKWSIVDGKLQITGSDFFETMTLISQSAEGFLVYDVFTQHSTHETTSEEILLSFKPFDTARTKDEVTMHYSALEHLSTYGVTIQQAQDFIIANLSNPEYIYNTCEQYDVTNQMIVEIFDNAYSIDTVKGYFSFNGLNPANLDLIG